MVNMRSIYQTVLFLFSFLKLILNNNKLIAFIKKNVFVNRMQGDYPLNGHRMKMFLIH